MYSFYLTKWVKYSRFSPKYLLIMRLTTLLLIATILQTSAATFAQKVTLSEKNASIIQVFDKISTQTGLDFLFTKSTLKGAKRISIDVRNAELRDVLDRIFKDQPFEFTIGNNSVVVSKTESPIIVNALPPQIITGKVTDSEGNPLAGASVKRKGDNVGISTGTDGSFSILVPDESAILVISYLGYKTQEVRAGRSTLYVTLEQKQSELGEVVVVGYGVQKKSDVTGSVSSLPKSRLDFVPNMNVTQAIQGAIPGVQVTTSSAGANPGMSIMIGGRRSITASNGPLVVVDGIAGNIADISPDDVASIEVLKDASAAAIYGSRGANGVILVTTKSGGEGTPKLSYNPYYSIQRMAKIPSIMTGEDFFKFKTDRIAGTGYSFTKTEMDNYKAGKFTDWVGMALRDGQTSNHDLSLSGGYKGTKYYISGTYTDVKGLAVNDKYKKVGSRINIDSKFSNWLTLGTRTQLNFIDQGGIAPTWDGDQGVFWANPLTNAYDANGNLTIYPWPEDTYFHNPFQGTLAKNTEKSYQISTNNYATIDFPFVPGLQYRLNTGIRLGFGESATYYGADTQTGFADRGSSSTSRSSSNSKVIENILNYNKQFGKHSVFLTAVYSYENNNSGSNSLSASGFPNDFLGYYSAAQAESRVPSYGYDRTALLSNMLRANYSYDNRYLLTLTGRRDGSSVFGEKTKWGVFPSAAIGWNIINEKFFAWKTTFSDLKLRVSYGLNGNQAINSFATISRLTSANIVGAGSTTLPGYIPSVLGQDDLGWESTKTFNAGLDFGILNNRITGSANYSQQNTFDLLLNRRISPIYAVSTITQNIGKTQNNEFDLSFVSRNIDGKNFKWETSGNISFIKNKIVSLYGYKDANGKEIDDVASGWFIGQPITANYGYKFIGVWQLNEAAEAAAMQTQPGYIKIQDVGGPNGVPDGKLTADYDRVIIGQRDPKFTWGMTNQFTYKNVALRVFMYGVQGVTKNNTLLNDVDTDVNVRMTTTKKNWWTPSNPTNDWYMNKFDANKEQGATANPYEDASFMRIKDISLVYTLPKSLLSSMGIGKFQVYLTGTNLVTLTKFGGMDPELSEQRDIPLQKEFVFGFNIDF
jgi:TonB-linked SusC/RagA family outer membrane protein